MTDAHQRFVSHVARHDPEGAITVEKILEKRDERTSQIDDASLQQMQRAEDAARLEFARKFYRLRKREPEGSWDESYTRFTPTERESLGRPIIVALNQSGYRKHKGWSHVYALCMRACAGKDVPEDIRHAFERDYPAIHERHMKAAVEARFKAENEAHEQAQREAKAQAKKEAAASREGRLAKRKAQRENLQRSLKKLMSREAALRTRLRKCEASIRMLEKKP